MYLGCSDTDAALEGLKPDQNKKHIISLAELYSYIKEYSPFLNDDISKLLNKYNLKTELYFKRYAG